MFESTVQVGVQLLFVILSPRTPPGAYVSLYLCVNAQPRYLVFFMLNFLDVLCGYLSECNYVNDSKREQHCFQPLSLFYFRLKPDSYHTCYKKTKPFPSPLPAIG